MRKRPREQFTIQQELDRRKAITKAVKTNRYAEKSLVVFILLSLLFWPGAWAYLWGCGLGIVGFVILWLFASPFMFGSAGYYVPILVTLGMVPIVGLVVGVIQIQNARTKMEEFYSHSSD